MSTVKQDLMELDLYGLLNIPFDASTKEIQKAYRRKALKCHPDKNPNNAAAAAEFERLQKVLEILLDEAARAAYNKLVKSRRLAEVRRRELTEESRREREKLDRREREAKRSKEELSAEQRYKIELARLDKEGQEIIKEEMARLEKEARKSQKSKKVRSSPPPQSKSYVVKVKWSHPEGSKPYTKEGLHHILNKWGENDAFVMEQGASEGKAFISYRTKEDAELAIAHEKGLPACAITLSRAWKEDKPKEVKTAQKRSRDYETLADMEKRRRNERAEIMAEIRRNDGV